MDERLPSGQTETCVSGDAQTDVLANTRVSGPDPRSVQTYLDSSCKSFVPCQRSHKRSDCRRIFGLSAWSLWALGHHGIRARGANRSVGSAARFVHRRTPAPVRPVCHPSLCSVQPSWYETGEINRYARDAEGTVPAGASARCGLSSAATSVQSDAERPPTELLPAGVRASHRRG